MRPVAWRYARLGLMRSHELTTGRTFGIAFDHDDDFFDTLTEFCTANNVRQGYIPMFIAEFAEAEIVARSNSTCLFHIRNSSASLAQTGSGGGSRGPV
jgi:hypothetical protein